MAQQQHIYFKSTCSNGYQWLSNFEPCTISVDDRQFRSVEHAYQVLKFERHIDVDYARLVLFPLQTAKAVKQTAGKGAYVEWKRQQTNSTAVSKQAVATKFDLALEKFKRHHSVELMRSLLKLKFALPEFVSRLKATGSARLHERGRFSTDFWAHTGADMLGKLLEEIRAQLV